MKMVTHLLYMHNELVTFATSYTKHPLANARIVIGLASHRTPKPKAETSGALVNRT